MGISSSIDIKLDEVINFDVKEILEIFKKHGWQYIVDDTISYLPLNDNEMYDWQFVNSKYEAEVLHTLVQKYRLNELIGICILNGEGGLTLLFRPKSKQICLLLDFSRKEIETSSSRLTDFTWYLNKIEPVLESLNVSSHSINCSFFH